MAVVKGALGGPEGSTQECSGKSEYAVGLMEGLMKGRAKQYIGAD